MSNTKNKTVKLGTLFRGGGEARTSITPTTHHARTKILQYFQIMMCHFDSLAFCEGKWLPESQTS
jgi:hypothetical protein